MKRFILAVVLSLTSVLSFSQPQLFFYFSVDGVSDIRTTSYSIVGSALGDINIQPGKEFKVDSVVRVEGNNRQNVPITYKRKNTAGSYAPFNMQTEFSTVNIETFDLMLVNPTNNYNYRLKINITNTASIKEIDNDQISVYPNPVKDILYVTCDEPVELYSMDGQLVLTTETDDKMIDMSGFRSGVYFLKSGLRMTKILKY